MRSIRPRSIPCAGRAIAAAALVILASAPIAHAVGGDPVRVFRSTGGAQAGLVHCAVAFSAAGEVFSAVNIRDDVSSVQVHRSTDRGYHLDFLGAHRGIVWQRFAGSDRYGRGRRNTDAARGSG